MLAKFVLVPRMASDILTVETGPLCIAYEAHRLESGSPILLLHGWPDDVRAWDGVAPALAASGR